MQPVREESLQSLSTSPKGRRIQIFHARVPILRNLPEKNKNKLHYSVVHFLIQFQERQKIYLPMFHPLTWSSTLTCKR